MSPVRAATSRPTGLVSNFAAVFNEDSAVWTTDEAISEVESPKPAPAADARPEGASGGGQDQGPGSERVTPSQRRQRALESPCVHSYENACSADSRVPGYATAPALVIPAPSLVIPAKAGIQGVAGVALITAKSRPTNRRLNFHTLVCRLQPA